MTGRERPWWLRLTGVPPESDRRYEGVSIQPFWPKADLVRGPDGRRLLVAVRANGVISSPMVGGAFWATLGLPIHLWAVARGRGWRLDVDDLDVQRVSLKSWKPTPWITTVAEFKSKSDAQLAAAALIPKIAGGDWEPP